MTHPLSELLDRFATHLPLTSTDPVLVVLKGHLLVEELLREYVRRIFQRPDELVDARLTFYQCLCLAKASDADPLNEKLWRTIEKLNSLRNKLAHCLEPKDIEATIRDFVLMLSNFDPLAPFADREKKFGALATCILGICMSLSHIVNSPRASTPLSKAAP